MIYEVEVSEQADNDLRGIFEYIAFELQSPENASGQLVRLEEQILSLDTMPERYRKYEKEPWKKSNKIYNKRKDTTDGRKSFGCAFCAFLCGEGAQFCLQYYQNFSRYSMRFMLY